jgi:hypothetical protein
LWGEVFESLYCAVHATKQAPGAGIASTSLSIFSRSKWFPNLTAKSFDEGVRADYWDGGRDLLIAT